MGAQVCVHSIYCLFSPRYRCVMLQEYLSKVFHLTMGGKGVGAFGLGQWVTFMTDPVHRNLILILLTITAVLWQWEMYTATSLTDFFCTRLSLIHQRWADLLIESSHIKRYLTSALSVYLIKSVCTIYFSSSKHIYKRNSKSIYANHLPIPVFMDLLAVYTGMSGVW